MTDRDKRQGGRPFKPDGKKPFAGRKPGGKKPGPSRDRKPGPPPKAQEGERIAKAMARAGACSRRDAEQWIAEGRVAVNGRTLESPAFNVTSADRITIDGKPLAERERTRLFLFHKPRGLVTTDRDPEGRQTIFDYLAERHPDLPRLMTVGRLDINTEGLLLLTNDGGLARTLELPATGWLRRYRVRAHGETDQAALDTLAKGVRVDDVDYAPIEAKLDRVQGANTWITLGLREGKNREVRRVLGSLGLEVNRLIRVSYGPFQLGDVAEGAVEEVKTRVLRDQLGPSLIAQSAADFEAPAKEREERPARATRERGERSERFERRDRPERDGERSDRFERRPRPERDGERPMRGRRFERDAEPVEEKKKTERPKPGSRKHVTTMRAERDEKMKAERVKISRGATEDRHGRAVVVERVTPTAPKAEPENRNARRFKAERDGERPIRRKPREDGGRPERNERGRPEGRERFSRGDAPRSPRGDGERRFEKRGDGDRPFRKRSESGEGARTFEGRGPRREGGERSFDKRPPRRDDRPRDDRPRENRFERGDGEKRFARNERGGDRPFKRDDARGERSFRSDRPREDRPREDRPRGDRPGGDKAGPRKFGGGKPGGRTFGGKSGDKPRGPRPGGDKPRSPRSGGDRPRSGGPRKPRGKD